jgi:hypothetical protein
MAGFNGSGGGVSNHGNLAGLGDDDHPHYLQGDGTESPSHSSVTTDDIDIASSDLISTGDDICVGSWNTDASYSRSGSSYNVVGFDMRVQWDNIVPSNTSVRVAVGGYFDNNGDQLNCRIQNSTDGETVIEGINLGANGGSQDYFEGLYTPTTTGSTILLRLSLRNSDGSTSVTVSDPTVTLAVEV